MSQGLKVTDLHKSFETESRPIEILRGVDLQLGAEDVLAITGPSGSGKSTLLQLIGTLDRPTSGSIAIDGQQPHGLPEPELARFRNEQVGFVFQDHHLLPQYSVLENVLVPSLAFPADRRQKEARARELIERVGLGERVTHRPAELSGGERQRAAVARALINQPRLLLCDEPTGSLDHATAQRVAELLFELQAEAATMLIIVTHSLDLAGSCRRRCDLRDGRLVS